MIILDTNVVSELMRPHPAPQVQAWLAGLGHEPLATTSVTVAEISFGVRRLPDGARRAALEARFAAFTGDNGVLQVLPVDAAAGREAGAFLALRQGRGLGATMADMLIAGVAAARAARLATRNVSDFGALPITLIDPWAV